MSPTIGRVVHYKTDGGDVVPAIVAKVITDTELLLYVMDAKEQLGDSAAYFANAVLEEGLPAGGRRWDWMPFQKQQQPSVVGPVASRSAVADSVVAAPVAAPAVVIVPPVDDLPTGSLVGVVSTTDHA